MAEGAGLAMAAALGFGAAIVVTRRGLRHMSALAGAQIAIPTSALLFWALSPFWFDARVLTSPALWVFAMVGVVYPALVAVLTFQSTHLLGPTVAAAVGSTAPLFSVAAAVIWLGEPVGAPLAVGVTAVVAGIVILAADTTGGGHRWARLAVLVPLAGALVRAGAEFLSKVGLMLLPSPFTAALVGYTVSSLSVSALARFGGRRAINWAGAPWFLAAAVLNGAAVLAVYGALTQGRLSVVAPIIASAPLVTLALQRVLLRQEPLCLRHLGGSLLVIAGMLLVVAWKTG